MSPFFSIILPVYNVQDCLERAVTSILTQGYQNYEIILVDDGSTDCSGQMCDCMLAQSNAIRVIHKTNGGLSSARNAGINAARGEYIWFVDSDDWIEEGALELLWEVANEKCADIIKFNYIRIDNEKSNVLSCAQSGDYLDAEQKKILAKQALLKSSRYGLSAWSHLYKRNFIIKNQLSFISEREIGSEDYLFNLHALFYAETICVLPQTLYYYERRSGSLTQVYKVNAVQKYTEMYRQLRDFYGQSSMFTYYEPMLCEFYVWHLLHGICIPNEYCVAEKHTLEDGRRNIAEFHKIPEFQEAARALDLSTFSIKEKVQLLAMKTGLEPLFYWLYVRKPQMKTGKNDDN